MRGNMLYESLLRSLYHVEGPNADFLGALSDPQPMCLGRQCPFPGRDLQAELRRARHEVVTLVEFPSRELVSAGSDVSW